MRKLTGRYYIRRRRFGGFDIKVEVELQNGYDGPKYLKLQEPDDHDLRKLGIWNMQSNKNKKLQESK